MQLEHFNNKKHIFIVPIGLNLNLNLNLPMLMLEKS
jgi:hypothetical protein